MLKNKGAILGISTLIVLILAGCQTPTDITFSNVHCTEPNVETDVDAQVTGNTLSIKVCVQCAGTPAEGASVEGHVVKTDNFDPQGAVGEHMTFANTSSDNSGCTTKDISISGPSTSELVGQRFEATVKDIKGKVATTGDWPIRSSENN